VAERLGIWLMRLLAGLAGAALLAAAAYVPVVQLLPKQVLLQKEFLFLFENDAFASSWPEFAERQRKKLAELAKMPDWNIPHLTVEADANRPVLKIRCRTIRYSGQEADFDRFLDACAKSLSQAAPSANEPPQDRLCPADRMYLTELRQKQKNLQEELAELDSTYQPLDRETFSLERRLEPDFGRRQSAFEEWIQPVWEKADASDETLAALRRQEQQARQDMARLDQHAAQSETESSLDDIKQRRDQKLRESQKIREDLEKRRDLLKGQIADQQWPLYQKRLQTQIEENHRVLAMYACKRNVLKTTLEQVDKNLQAMHPLLLAPADSSEMLSGRTNGSSPLSPLQIPTVKTETLSAAQKMAILLAAAAGFILGVVFLPVHRLRAACSSPHAKPVLGNIPPASPPADSAGKTPNQIDSAGFPAELVRISIQQEFVSPEHTSRDGRWAEPYDRLADLLQPICKQVSCPAILLTAPDSSQASPRVAVNLAIALARRQCRTLLIEADSARNDLADIFDVPVEPGFTDWLAGRMDAAHMLSHQPLDHLFFLPAGKPIQPGTESKTQIPQRRDLWPSLRKQLDLILFYGPCALTGKAGPFGNGESLHHVVHAALTMARAAGDLAEQKRRLDAQLQILHITHLGLIALE